MVRAVLDTNVLASGATGFLIPESIPGQLLRAWQNDRFELIVSEHILTELSRTLQKPYFLRRLSQEQINHTLRLLRRRASMAQLTVSVSGVATHPEDDLVLATAVSGRTDYLVTGDRQFRERVGTHQGVRLISPHEFLELLDQGDQDS